MKVRVFTLRFDEMQRGFDETSILAFFKDKQVINVSDHFFIHEGEPCLALVVTYKLALPQNPESKEKKSRKDRDASWKDLLRPEEYPMFNTLREWRLERCKADGVPPYIICTNKQLAKMVQMQPESLVQLTEIEGFGKSKREKYGTEILKFFMEQPDKKVRISVADSANTELPEEPDA